MNTENKLKKNFNEYGLQINDFWRKCQTMNLKRWAGDCAALCDVINDVSAHIYTHVAKTQSFPLNVPHLLSTVSGICRHHHHHHHQYQHYDSNVLTDYFPQQLKQLVQCHQQHSCFSIGKKKSDFVTFIRKTVLTFEFTLMLRGSTFSYKMI